MPAQITLAACQICLDFSGHITGPRDLMDVSVAAQIQEPEHYIVDDSSMLICDSLHSAPENNLSGALVVYACVSDYLQYTVPQP